MSIGSTLNGWGDHRDDVSALHVRDFGSWFSPVIFVAVTNQCGVWEFLRVVSGFRVVRT